MRWRFQSIKLCLSVLGPGCVKTRFRSKFSHDLREYENLRFSKVLISLKLELVKHGQNRNSNGSRVFLHSLGQSRRYGDVRALSAYPRDCRKVVGDRGEPLRANASWRCGPQHGTPNALSRPYFAGCPHQSSAQHGLHGPDDLVDRLPADLLAPCNFSLREARR
jgi:hypothetical protein